MNTLSMNDVAKLLRSAPHKGVDFWDIQPILRDVAAETLCYAAIAKYWKDVEFDVIAAFDARGFIFGKALALTLGKPFEMIRKEGKLPGKTKKQAYSLEYGNSVLEMLDDGFIEGKRVLLVDDVLATGGTALAGCQLIESLGGIVIGFEGLIELPFLHGRSKLGHIPVHSLISIVDDTPVADVEYCVDMIVEHPDEPNMHVIVNRLTKPHKFALPGGRIESCESSLSAMKRELKEEVGYTQIVQVKFVTTLTGLVRDLRGVKVSLLYRVTVTDEAHGGEEGGTDVIHISSSDLGRIMPKDFAFDMYDVIHEHLLPAANAA